MKRKLIISSLLIGTLALLAGLGISNIHTASAAAPAAEDVSTPNQMLSGEAGRGRGLNGQDDEYLAEALGITTDELDAARQAAYEAGMAQAVEQGLITQEEVDALKSDDGTLPYSHRQSGWLTRNDIDFEAMLADALGISTGELQEAQLTARYARIDQAVTDSELTEEQALLMKARYALSNSQKFQDSMQSAYEAAIQQAVEDGLITQEQADLLLQNAMDFSMHGIGGRGMDGGHGHHGGPKPSDDAPADQSDQTETP